MTYYNRLKHAHGTTSLDMPMPFYKVKQLASQLSQAGQRTRCWCWLEPDDAIVSPQPPLDAHTFTVSPRI